MKEPEKTILVVDDEEAIRKLITIHLGIRGFKSLSADTGEKGLKLAAEAKPDLILLDVAIPDMSGMEVLKTLKADPGLKDIPVIMLSFYPLDHGVEMFLEAGATAYLVKSMNFKELINRIASVMEGEEK